jgi:hypothetical protein
MVPIIGRHSRSPSDTPGSVGSLEVIQEALLASTRREEAIMLAHDEQQRTDELRFQQMMTSNAELQSSGKALMLSNAKVQADLKLLKAELKAESTAAEDPATKNNTPHTAFQIQTAIQSNPIQSAPLAPLANKTSKKATPELAVLTSTANKTSKKATLELAVLTSTANKTSKKATPELAVLASKIQALETKFEAPSEPCDKLGTLSPPGPCPTPPTTAAWLLALLAYIDLSRPTEPTALSKDHFFFPISTPIISGH